MYQAICSGNVEAVTQLLRQGWDVNTKDVDGNGRPAIVFAAQMRHGSIIQTLLEWKADVNAQSSNGVTALQLIVGVKNLVDCARLLIHSRADLSLHSDSGFTPLHSIACWKQDQTLFPFLLEHGADPLVRDSEGRTPFDLLVDNDHRQSVRLLLERGVKLSQLKPHIHRPPWLLKFIESEKRCKASFVAFYGVLRKRMRIPLDMVRMLSMLLCESRFEWEK